MRNTLSLFFCLMLLVSCGSADVEVVSAEPVTDPEPTVEVAVEPEPTVEVELTQEALEEEVPVKVDEPVKVNPTETESEKPVEEARSIDGPRVRARPRAVSSARTPRAGGRPSSARARPRCRLPTGRRRLRRVPRAPPTQHQPP